MESVDFRRWTVKELKYYLTQYDVDMRDIEGTGANGNITKADLINAIEDIEEGITRYSIPNTPNIKIPNTKIPNTKYDFDLLPGDVQAEIFNKDISLSRKSPYISKSISRATNQNVCQLPILLQEIINYINTFVPEKIYVFLVGGIRPQTKFNVNKHYLVRHPKDNQPAGYHAMIDWITLFDNNTVDMRSNYKTDMVVFNTQFFRIAEDAKRVFEYDLLTMYNIYNNRLSCKQHAYAKNKVIATLRSKQLDLNKNVPYTMLLPWYMYLRTNLLQFPVQLPINNYFDYKVTMDEDDNIILVEPYMEPRELIGELKSQCNDMYQLLLKQLNLLE